MGKWNEEQKQQFGLFPQGFEITAHAIMIAFTITTAKVVKNQSLPWILELLFIWVAIFVFRALKDNRSSLSDELRTKESCRGSFGRGSLYLQVECNIHSNITAYWAHIFRYTQDGTAGTDLLDLPVPQVP